MPQPFDLNQVAEFAKGLFASVGRTAIHGAIDAVAEETQKTIREFDKRITKVRAKSARKARGEPEPPQEFEAEVVVEDE
jgi:hypothetical protein